MIFKNLNFWLLYSDQNRDVLEQVKKNVRVGFSLFELLNKAFETNIKALIYFRGVSLQFPTPLILSKLCDMTFISHLTAVRTIP